MRFVEFCCRFGVIIQIAIKNQERFYRFDKTVFCNQLSVVQIYKVAVLIEKFQFDSVHRKCFDFKIIGGFLKQIEHFTIYIGNINAIAVVERVILPLYNKIYGNPKIEKALL